MKKDLVSDFCHSFLKECFIDTNGCLGVLLGPVYMEWGTPV